MEMMVVGIVAVLLFGRRLPEVGRSLGKGIVEFKKGLRGLEDDDPAPSTSTTSHYRTDSYAATDLAPAASVPRFEPPASAPTVDATSSS
jgi:sec-independent protein translocase protein TatA